MGCLSHPPSMERVKIELMCWVGAKQAVAEHISSHSPGREPLPRVGVAHVPKADLGGESRAVQIGSIDRS